MTAFTFPPRARLGPVTFYPPSFRGRVTLPAPVACWSVATPPDVSSTLAHAWNSFGLAPSAAQTAQVTVRHCVSDPAAFDSVSGQLYAAGNPVGSPVALTPSQVMISETVSTGAAVIAAADMPSLELRVTWHQVAMGFASAGWAQALTPAVTTAAVPLGGMLAGGII